ncbi:MAG: TetR/AcrR family transcriptional regulator [Sphingomicrobium sp.]
MDARLTKQDWISQGLRTLATEGAGALKVGAMAAVLRVSRGSFYWHFTDFADYRSQLLQSWRDRTVNQVIREFDEDAGAPDRMRRLVRRAFFGKRGLDRAIRIWAADEPSVTAMVASVDARRVAYMVELLVTGGVAPAEAEPRAAFIYWAYLGQPIVMNPDHASMPEPALDAISALFEL